MSDYEMPYYADDKGDRGFFVDPTAREQIDEINNRNNFNPNLMKNRGDASSDLNDIKVNGLYTYRTTNTNTPSSWGTLMVINVTPDNLSIAWVYQVAFATDGHIYHRRSINGSAFNAWATIV